MNMTNRPYNNKDWSVYKHELVNIKNPDGQSIQVTVDRLATKNNEHLDVLSYFLVNGKPLDGLVSMKIASLMGILRLQYDIKIVCVAITPDSVTTQKPIDALIEFASNLKIL